MSGNYKKTGKARVSRVPWVWKLVSTELQRPDEVTGLEMIRTKTGRAYVPFGMD